MLASVLQVTGAALIAAAVYVANPVAGIGLTGVFFIVFGIALERRGKKGGK